MKLILWSTNGSWLAVWKTLLSHLLRVDMHKFPCGRNCSCTYFSEEEILTQRGWVTCLSTHSQGWSGRTRVLTLGVSPKACPLKHCLPCLSSHQTHGEKWVSANTCPWFSKQVIHLAFEQCALLRVLAYSRQCRVMEPLSWLLNFKMNKSSMWRA